jgi:alkylhydroperoxidase family enzyme
VPNYFLALGRDAQLLQDRMNLFTNAMFKDHGLPRAIKKLVALAVSGCNLDSYCVAAHLSPVAAH